MLCLGWVLFFLLPFWLLVLFCFLAELYEIFLSRAKERWKSFSETSSENDIEGEISWVLNNLLFTFTNPGSLTSSSAISALTILVKSSQSHALLKCLLSYNKSVSEGLGSTYCINKRQIKILHVLLSSERFLWNTKIGIYKNRGNTKSRNRKLNYSTCSYLALLRWVLLSWHPFYDFGKEKRISFVSWFWNGDVKNMTHFRFHLYFLACSGGLSSQIY